MIGMVELFDRFFGIAAATHSDPVQPKAFGVVSLDDRERRSVFDYDRVTADESFVPDAAKLMHARISAHICTVCYLHVTGESGGVRHDHVVADLAIVGDMDLRHQQAVITDPGQTATAGGSAMHGDELPDIVSLADLNAGRFPPVFQVLRSKPDRHKRVN